jgi:predicted amidophosphoribosyltransferase
MDDLNRAAGICPHCGHEVEPNWVLCDNCGQRLPWAPPKKIKSLNELTDEELAARFAPSRQSVTPWWVSFLKTWHGKAVVMLIASLFWEILNRLFFHFY